MKYNKYHSNEKGALHIISDVWYNSHSILGLCVFCICDFECMHSTYFKLSSWYNWMICFNCTIFVYSFLTIKNWVKLRLLRKLSHKKIVFLYPQNPTKNLWTGHFFCFFLLQACGTYMLSWKTMVVGPSPF